MSKANVKIKPTENVVEQVAILDQVFDLISKGASSLPLEESDYTAIYAMGHQYYMQARYEDAAHIFTFLYRKKPFDNNVLKGLAASRQGIGKYGLALEAWSAASILDMDDPEPSLFACECLLHLKEYKKANFALEAAEIQMDKNTKWLEKKDHLSSLLQKHISNSN